MHLRETVFFREKDCLKRELLERESLEKCFEREKKMRKGELFKI